MKKDQTITIRARKDTVWKLKECAKITTKSQSRLIEEAVDRMYEEYRDQIMSYQKEKKLYSTKVIDSSRDHAWTAVITLVFIGKKTWFIGDGVVKAFACDRKGDSSYIEDLEDYVREECGLPVRTVKLSEIYPNIEPWDDSKEILIEKYGVQEIYERSSYFFKEGLMKWIEENAFKEDKHE